MSTDHPGLADLFDKNGARFVQAAIGKKIKTIELAKDLNPEKLLLSFDDGTKLALYDAARNCCESRYMSCDDDLPSFVGSTFTGLELRDAPDVALEEGESDYGQEHEVQFLLVNTSSGSFTISTHNEHNGYYGGFSLKADEWV